MEQESIIRLLRESAAFATARQVVLEKVADGLRERPVPAGTAVIVEGEDGGDLYLIAEGECEVTLRGEVLGRLGAGEVFGEIASIGASVRTASVHAATEARLLVLAQSDLLAIVRSHPNLAAAILRSMARYLGD